MTNREIIDQLTARYVRVPNCRACDNTGSIPGNYMGDPSSPCFHCGRGVNLGTIIRELEADKPIRCFAPLFHGPGHQSKTLCEKTGPHDVHETHYRGGIARWRDGQYTGRLRAKGIVFNPESYPENMAMTGFFDEPPDEEDA